jgi:hypothetical protein
LVENIRKDDGSDNVIKTPEIFYKSPLRRLFLFSWLNDLNFENTPIFSGQKTD